MTLRHRLRMKTLEVKNEQQYRLMLQNEPDAVYPPWFFTWVDDQKFATFAWPQTAGNLEYLWLDGIRHILTLTPEIPDVAATEFGWSHIPIEEGKSPTIEQIFKFIRVVQWCRKRDLPLGIHCRLGLGRTGVMLAIYLMYFHGMDAERALKNLRYLRPGSVDSQAQEDCVLNYRPAAKLANEKRLKNITKRGDHFLDILKNDNERKKGSWGLPRAWGVSDKLL